MSNHNNYDVSVSFAAQFERISGRQQWKYWLASLLFACTLILAGYKHELPIAGGFSFFDFGMYGVIGALALAIQIKINLIDDLVLKNAIAALLYFIFSLLIIAFSSLAMAETERVIRYEYDGAGNIIRIISAEQSLPPEFSQISPSFINIGRSITVVIEGNNLLNAQITTDSAGLTIQDIINVELQRVSFRLIASNQANLGEAILTLTTSFGSVNTTVSIAEKRPVLTTVPSPVVFETSTDSLNLILNFSEPRPADERYTISIDNPDIASTSVTELILGNGERSATLPINANALGVTILRFTETDKMFSYTFPLFVSESFESYSIQFPEVKSDKNIFGQRVGVYVQPSNSQLEAVYSEPVGVLLQTTSAENNTLFSSTVGISVGTNRSGLVLSSPIGVEVGLDDTNLFSLPVGTVVGTYVESVTPEVLERDASYTLDIRGVQLDDVTSITLGTTNNITIGQMTISDDGRQILLPVTLNSEIAPGEYELMLQTIDGSLTSRYGRYPIVIIQ